MKDRRKFFKMGGASVLGLGLLSLLPLKLFSKGKAGKLAKSKFKVEAHPMAISRQNSLRNGDS